MSVNDRLTVKSALAIIVPVVLGMQGLNMMFDKSHERALRGEHQRQLILLKVESIERAAKHYVRVGDIDFWSQQIRHADSLSDIPEFKTRPE